MLLKGGLQGSETFDVGSQALHRGDLAPIGGGGQHQAAAYGFPIDDHRAGSAVAVLTPQVGAGQPQMLPEQVGEERAGLDFGSMGPAVHGQIDGDPLAGGHNGHAASSSRINARRTISVPTWSL